MSSAMQASLSQRIKSLC